MLDVNVDLNGDDQNGDNSKEENGMNQYGDAASGHVTALQHSPPRRQLKEKSRR